MTPESPAAPVAGAALTAQDPIPLTNLPEEDGEPLESDWHRLAMNLLVEILRYHFRERRDFYAGGNMFLYYSSAQVRNRDYRGPDVFFAWDVERDKSRRYWAVWDEGGKYPDLIIELLSPTTAKEDRTTKKNLYERIFQTREYFLYDPDTGQFEGYRLHVGNGGRGGYEPIEVEQNGRLWSHVLELYLGTWQGVFQEIPGIWLRFFDVHGNLIRIGLEDQKELTKKAKELADKEKERADNEKERADNEKELARKEKERADNEKESAKKEKERANELQDEVSRLRARLEQLEGKP